MKLSLTIPVALLLISAVSGLGAAETGTVDPAELDAFMEKWAEYESFRVPDEPNDEPILQAALEKDPSGPWATYLAMKFATTRYEARKLEPADRAARYRAALKFLEPARAPLVHAVKTAPDNEETQFGLNAHLYSIEMSIALASLEAGVNPGAVKAFAEEALAKNQDPGSWNHGNIIFEAHTLLGRLALREGKIEEAKKQLLASGQTSGSPQLNSYGPELVLARELMEKGERDTVLEFLDLVARFWANPEERTEANFKRSAREHLAQLEKWRKQIRAGEIPDNPQWK